MLRSRVIPCLLVKNKGLVKTVNFGNPKYVGDPINAVKIFNEKEVDELMVLDIDGTVKGQEPDYEMIRNLAAECRMPFCYGGGIKTVEQAARIISLGVEKIAISSAAIENPKLVQAIATAVGSQSVVVVLDVKKKGFLGHYGVFTHNGKKDTRKDPIKFAQEIEQLGVGEIVINSIDNDGLMKGYDQEIFKMVRNAVGVPLTLLGGAGHIDHIKNLIDEYKIVGAAAGSLFVFKGVYRAVLINYQKPYEVQ